MSLAPYRERANAASTLCSARNLSSCFSGAICEQDRCGWRVRRGCLGPTRGRIQLEKAAASPSKWGIQVR